MPSRSVHLKFIVDRRPSGEELRRSLWVTHRVVNDSVAQIERVLLLCRGSGYLSGDGELVTAETVQGDALRYAGEARERNGNSDPVQGHEILGLLRSLYEAMVPSAVLDEHGKPQKGDAQSANAFCSPLMDLESRGFESIFEKILEKLPPWVEKMESSIRGWEEESTLWLKSSEAITLQNVANRPPKWVGLVRKQKPWQEAFVEDQRKKKKEAPGVPTLMRRLREIGLLPLLAPPITSRIPAAQGRISPWDRMALRLAVAHLLSWESWNHRAREEYQKIQGVYERLERQLSQHQEMLECFRAYERNRHEELVRVTGLAGDGRTYRIGGRAIRAWDRIREAWSGKAGATQDTRLEALARLQSNLGGRFGDPELFRWLAQDSQQSLWQGADLLPDLVRLNALDRLLESRRDQAAFTPACSRMHPRYTMYEAPGGTNLRNFRLEEHEGRLTLRLPLLRNDDGRLVEHEAQIALAPSKQFAKPVFVSKESGSKIRFHSANQEFVAALGGSELLFDRRHLESRPEARIAEGDIGRVWLKLTIDIDSQAPTDWLDGKGAVRTSPAVRHFLTGLGKPSKSAADVVPGLRILSVDLGIRCLGACSVYEVVSGQPKRGAAYLIDEARKLWAKHERSFLLTLPGEDIDEKIVEARKQAYSRLGELRYQVRQLKDVLRLSLIEQVEERRIALDKIRTSWEDESKSDVLRSFDQMIIDGLSSVLERPFEAWKVEIQQLYRSVERSLGQLVSKWRTTTRPRSVSATDGDTRRAYAGGKSLWAIEYLENVRRFLLGWSLHGRSFGEIRRADRERHGIFAARLLRHINNLKDDRTKSGADLLVQAARGFIPTQEGGWVQRYQPCRAMVFEDLARYRFRTDRPRRENSQLMRWSHRELIKTVAMQAEIYGITAETIGAGFTSRFHSATGAPGFRMRRITKADVESPRMSKLISEVAERLKCPPGVIVPGVRLPWEGGEEFCTLNGEHEPICVHADVNAAQNLQRRFWTRHRDAFRISALEVHDGTQTAWYPDRLGSRLQGALVELVGGSGHGRLRLSPDGDGFELQRCQKSEWQRATGQQATTSDEEALDDVGEIIENALEVEESALERGGKAVFFRDSSGLVLRSDRWYESKEFWSRVSRTLASATGLTEKAPF